MYAKSLLNDFKGNIEEKKLFKRDMYYLIRAQKKNVSGFIK